MHILGKNGYSIQEVRNRGLIKQYLAKKTRLNNIHLILSELNIRSYIRMYVN